LNRHYGAQMALITHLVASISNINVLFFTIHKMKKYIIFYHIGCRDGFLSAAIIYNHMKENNDLIFKAISPNKLEEEIKAASSVITSPLSAIFVDLAFTTGAYLAATEAFEDFMVYDHHITTKEVDQKANIVFDIDHSAASIVFTAFNPGQAIPPIVQYVEARDLWRFDLPDVKIISDGLFEILPIEYTEALMPSISLYPGENKGADFAPWLTYLADLEGKWVPEAKIWGQAASNLKDRICKQASKMAHMAEWNSYKVGICNSTNMQSDVANCLYEAKDNDGNYIYDFVIVWRVVKDKVWISLRKRKGANGLSMATVAKMMDPNGGGHVDARAVRSQLAA
jgi:oligoribonuclease NrnB/cAMP/cGMP phosphodiesterase (DHH superfamily)